MRFSFRLTVFWGGAAVMAFELAGARLLMPCFGIGIEVWAAVITVTLGVLAAGYWIGGRIADVHPRETPLAIVLFLGGLAILIVSRIGAGIPPLFMGLSFAAGAWLAAAAILCVPLLLLGMVPPMVTRILMPDAAHAGRVVGGLLALATLGSMLGTALTGLLLLPQVGLTRTLWLLAIVTMSLMPVIWITCGRWLLGSLAGAVVAAAGVATWQPPPLSVDHDSARVLESIEGYYGRLEVIDIHGRSALLCNGVFQAAMPPSGVALERGMLIQSRDYTELIPFLRPAARKAMLIGLGGGLHIQVLSLYGIDVRAVEIESAVVELAERHFGLRADVAVGDGRAVLARTSECFDAVILDTFIGGSAPEHLYTVEAFRRIADVLVEDGLLVIHLIGHPRHPAALAVERTLQAVFDHTLGARSGHDEELQHLYLFASRAPLVLQDSHCVELAHHGYTGEELFQFPADRGILLTDDRTCLALLSRELEAEHHRRSRAVRRQP